MKLKMKKTMLDTSVYGRIIENNEVDEIKKITENKIIIYGNRLIRKELRDTPKKIKIADGKRLRNLRVYLLTLYDELVKNHSFEITKEMLDLAENYYDAYKELGGSKGKKDIINDFVIIACASIKKIDLVVSEDERSMFGRNAIRAYKLVNKIKNLRTPNFINYENFKMKLRSSKFDKLMNDFSEFRVFNIFFILFPYIFTFWSLFFWFHGNYKNKEYLNFSAGSHAREFRVWEKMGALRK